MIPNPALDHRPMTHRGQTIAVERPYLAPEVLRVAFTCLEGHYNGLTVIYRCLIFPRKKQVLNLYR